MALLHKADQSKLDLSGIEEFDTQTQVYHLTKDEQIITIENLTTKPVASLLRDFSAPIKLIFKRSKEELAYLLSHDDNGFNQFDAGQTLMQMHLIEQYQNLKEGNAYVVDEALLSAMDQVFKNELLSNAIKASMLTLPSFSYLSDQIDKVDVDLLLDLLTQCKTQIALKFEKVLLTTFNTLNDDVKYEFEAKQVGKRSFKSLCLGYLSRIKAHQALAASTYNQSSNMTDTALALNIIANGDDKKQKQKVFTQFYAKWKQDTQMVEQWLAIQARGDDTSLADIKLLMAHEAFDIKTPNKVRSVIGAFAMGNPVHFHAKDGSGYEFLADQILVLNELNPQIASRLCGALTHFKRYDDRRSEQMLAQLNRINACNTLSKDVKEVITRSIQSA